MILILDAVLFCVHVVLLARAVSRDSTGWTIVHGVFATWHAASMTYGVL